MGKEANRCGRCKWCWVGDPWFTGVQTDPWEGVRAVLVLGWGLESLMFACHVHLRVTLQLRVHAGIRPQVPPGLSVPAGPSRNLSTIPNQGCCSQVFGDNVSASRQMLDRMSPHELPALFADLRQRLGAGSGLKGWVSHHLI